MLLGDDTPAVLARGALDPHVRADLEGKPRRFGRPQEFPGLSIVQGGPYGRSKS
jgi:hypothetical protein